ncbi:isoprenylcysteine carboxylmethyltransferase family protein [Alphaproteobacteria bacterium GH1-50]|uniref:Isoprenylcysteine carboxylmethyltransferase family protein n=1 Tax=Kangsaoukella pontilimi TaxID=2691042 RepID=A0A7C9MEZ9_9RHOB|nr:isoprenylcysteine carboxylmethyltransferase family protein [Kangsaoukella pontilimi]MXQ09171.1 isoprenylcysteine carboxylmethyltransferase family protein [Kangsaoukella pontilimi]
MTAPSAAHENPWKISDVVIFPLIALGLTLEWFLPTSFGGPRTLTLVAGLLIVGAGFGLITWSKRTLDASEQPSLPGAPTTELVTGGPFARSRNPNYLGAIVAILGGALAFDALWLIGAAFFAALVLDRWMIRPEETYLAETFGKTYADYAGRVRRWF